MQDFRVGAEEVAAVAVGTDTAGMSPPDDAGFDLPQSASPEVTPIACRVITRAEAMGLIDVSAPGELSMTLLARALGRFAEVGIGRTALTLHAVHQDLAATLIALNHDIEASPHPQTEWAAVIGVLGKDKTAQLCGVSASSARRYQADERPTPDDVAARLHFLALVIADLLGAYNSFGVRRWFDRPRQPLGNRSPAEILTGDWQPEDGGAQTVRDLAAGLLTMAAT